MSKRVFFYIAFIGLLVIFVYVVGAVKHAGEHARNLVGLLVGGQERLTELHVKTTLIHLAEMQKQVGMSPKACELFRNQLEINEGFFAVLALGDAEGNAVCTADPKVNIPLPTMKDRLYFERAQKSSGLVAGEYALSRTTGKPTIHYAYPIRNEEGVFMGLILGGVDLKWFAYPLGDQYFEKRDAQILVVDQAGKLLFGYPSNNYEVGQTVVGSKQMSTILAGSVPFQLMRGPDGKYRVYSYKSFPSFEGGETLILVGETLF